MENNENMNDIAVVENVEVIECGEGNTALRPATAFALGAAAVFVGRFVYKKAIKPMVGKIKGLRKKKTDTIDDVDYAEVDNVDVSGDTEE